ncbi:hypothetical protein G7068_10120 [Leucobacter viscericola]|uniref:Gram-positive cocci surface proteins LPxTG domain-containing protein n=1 Tax=Leucobacter viscericola TaxID=2714935 RepID=A0A6G7XFY6_9MICO|nr:DUF11 domain-containing protein [Leucobacter viscericola]QIK63514.1 hypothetical protein G7068_10120 [Leucobacter viscericola]
MKFKKSVSALVAALVCGVLAIPATSAMAAPGDLAYAVSIGEVRTGTAPFDATAGPGNDVSPTDSVLRSHDTVSWDVAVSANSLIGASADAKNATITFTLPEGLEWNTLPAQCISPAGGPASEISADGKTATCNLGDIPLGSSPVVTLSATAQSQPDGTELNFAPDAVSFKSDDPDAPAATTAPKAVTITSAPRLNMTKVAAPFIATNVLGPDGVTRGWSVQYGVTVSVPGMNTKGVRGYQTPDQPVSFVDDLSGISPNAQLLEVKGTDITNHPEFPGFSVTSVNADYAVSNGGVWTGSVDPANPQKVTVSIANADLSANHLPTKTRGGAAIADNKGYLTLGTITVFVPLSDVPGYETGAGSIAAKNVIRDLVANGTSADGATVENTGEDLSDNTSTANLTITTQGAMSKRFVDIINNPDRTPFLPNGTTSDRSGDGPLIAGQQVQSYISVQNVSTAAALNDVKACDVWDSTEMSLAKFQTAPTGRWAWPSGSEGSPAYVRGGVLKGHFEYLTGYTLNGDEDARWDQMRSFNCADNLGTWTDQATALADPSFDLDKVSAVRFIADADADIAAGQNNVILLVNLERRADVAPGSVIANMAGWSSSDLNGGKYRPAGYGPGTNEELTTLTRIPTTGDRMIAVDAAVGVAKTAAVPRIAVGAAGQFTLTPKVLDLGTAGGDVAQSVTVTDTVPAGLFFIEKATTINGQAVAAPSYEPSSVVVNADGSTTVTWKFDSITRGEEPVITYSAQAADTAHGDYVNTVAIASVSDGAAPAPGELPTLANDRHMAQATVSVDGPAGIAVSKVALNPVIEAGEDFAWRVNVANGSSVTTQTDPTVIDVLPYIGDDGSGASARVPGTTNAAKYRLTGPVSMPAGATAMYTTDDSRTVQLSQELGDVARANFGTGVNWVDYVAVADQLDKVTGVKVTFAPMAPQTDGFFTYSLTHVSGNEGGIWSNNASFRTAEAPLGVLSNTVTTTMEPGPVAIDLVKSASAPANGVSYTAGETVNYTFVATNTGSRELRDVSVAEDQFTNGAGDALSLSTPITVVKPADFNGTLAPGASVTYQASYVVTVDDQVAGGEITNSAIATGKSATGDPVEASSEVAVNVDLAKPGIDLVKSVANKPSNGTAFTPGEKVEYSFTVRNTGNVPLSAVEVTEDSFTNAKGDALKLDGPLVAPQGFDGLLNPGETVVLSGTYTVTKADVAGKLVNTATATGDAPKGTTPGTVTDTSTADADVAQEAGSTTSTSPKTPKSTTNTEPGTSGAVSESGTSGAPVPALAVTGSSLAWGGAIAGALLLGIGAALFARSRRKQEA